MTGAGDKGAMCPRGLAYVPPGTVTIGCNGNAKCDPKKGETPRAVQVSGTCWDATEFTERQMEGFKTERPGVADNLRTTCDIKNPRGAWNWIRRFFGVTPSLRTETCNKPVNNVTWFEADAICKARGMRLPAMTEYRRAALGESGRDKFGTAGGLLTDDHGRRLAQYGKWYLIDGRGDVASYPPKVFGSAKIYDLAGNVEEWVEDEGATKGPAKSGGSRFEKVCGGSWGDDGFSAPHNLRASACGNIESDVKSGQIGFRCVSDADSTETE